MVYISFAGFESAQKLPISREVPLSHCRMRQLLPRSSMWHRMCRTWRPAPNVRKLVSQAAVVEGIEAIEAGEPSEKKAVHRQRWQAHETMTLIEAKKQQDLMGVESTEAAGIETNRTKKKWKEVEAFCRKRGVERSAQQCQTRWSRLLSAFTQIRRWEEARKSEQPSFWSLKLDERKTMGFLLSLDQKTYNALDGLLSTKADAIENVFINNNAVEVAELGGVSRIALQDEGMKCNTDEADTKFSCKGMTDEINLTNTLSSSYKRDEMVHTKGHNISKPILVEPYERDLGGSDDKVHLEELEECSRENDYQCKAMEKTKILSEFLQIAMGDRNNEQLPHVSTGNTDLNPVVQPTGHQIEESKVSGIADHSHLLILCNQDDVHVKAQLSPAASAERIDGRNKESYQLPLVAVDGCNKAQLPHATAENMDCNPSKLQTSMKAEFWKHFQKGECSTANSGSNPRDAYVKMEFLPASVEIIDGNEKNSCNGSQAEHRAEENANFVHGNDANVSLSSVVYNGIVQAADDKLIEEGADGILSKTSASVIDSLAEEGFVSVSASESHLSFLGVDVLNANQSTQTTPLSHFSADKDDCQTYSVDRMLVEEVWVAKNAEAEGDKENSYICPCSSEDISVASADSVQSNFMIEAQNKNDACEILKHQGKLDPVRDSKDEISTDILEQGPPDNGTFPVSINIESTQRDQDKESEKFELCLPVEGHTEMIAEVMERDASMLECGDVHKFEEKKAGHAQNGNNVVSKKTSEPSQSIKRSEVALLDMYSELRNQIQSGHRRDGNDAFEGSELASKEGDWVVGIGPSTVDSNPSAHMSIDYQSQHVSEQENRIKGNAGSFQSVSEAGVVEVAASKPTKLDFLVKDDRGTTMSAERSIADGSQKTSARGPVDEDVFLNIPAATGSLVKSALQTFRKFFNF